MYQGVCWGGFRIKKWYGIEIYTRTGKNRSTTPNVFIFKTDESHNFHLQFQNRQNPSLLTRSKIYEPSQRAVNYSRRQTDRLGPYYNIF